MCICFNSNQTDCLPCIPGSYCNSTGLTKPTGLCQEGYYCNGSSDNSKQFLCEPGYYCKEGSSQPVLCPPGEYQTQDGQTSCYLCPEGIVTETFLNNLISLWSNFCLSYI